MALGLGITTVIVLLRPPAETVYQGRTVTQWLDRMRYCSPTGFQPGEPQTDPALVAIKRIGSPAASVCFKHLSTAREFPLEHRLWMQARTFANYGTRPPDPTVSRWTCAAAALIYLGPGQEGGVSKVIQGVLKAPITRPAAANAFFLIGTNEPSVLPALLAGLEDSRVPVREFCAEAIGSLIPWAGPALLTLTNLVNDPDLVVRNYAIGTLGGVGKGNPALAELIRDAMARTTNGDVIASGVRALNQLASP